MARVNVASSKSRYHGWVMLMQQNENSKQFLVDDDTRLLKSNALEVL
jgi:hypothetical protein